MAYHSTGTTSKILCLVAILFVACESRTQTPPPSPTPAVAAPTVTVTSASLPTITPRLTNTPQPPTKEQKVKQLRHIIATNGDCSLPCWWGGSIVPGQTTMQEADAHFNSLGLFLNHKQGLPQLGFDVGPTVNGHFYSTFLVIQADSKNVTNLIYLKGLSGTHPSLTPASLLSEDWEPHYSWGNVMQENGAPSKVMLALIPSTFGEVKIAPSYRLYIFYEQLGMALWYEGPAEESSSSMVRACPQFESLSEVGVRLVPPTHGASLVSEMMNAENNDTNPALTPDEEIGLASARDLADVVGIGIEEFYQKFVTDRTDCFEGQSTLFWHDKQ